MDSVALACILVAAVLHAAWNVLLKTAGDPLRTATLGVVSATALLVPVVLAGWLVLGRPAVPPQAWGIGIVSGGVEVAYFVFLAAAYRRGDLSVVYPLARGSAPLFAVALGVVILGERLPPAGWAGVGLILAGLLAIQRPWRFLGLRAPGSQRAAAGFALLTGIMIATYSGLDRVGVQQVPPWLFAGILWPVCAIGLGVVWLVRRRPAARDRASVSPAAVSAATREPHELRWALAWGLMMLLAYGFVLAAYSRAPLVIVGPLREVSLVITSIWAVVALREAVDRRERALRVGGAVLVLGGAMVLAVAA